MTDLPEEIKAWQRAYYEVHGIPAPRVTKSGSWWNLPYRSCRRSDFVKMAKNLERRIAMEKKLQDASENR